MECSRVSAVRWDEGDKLVDGFAELHGEFHFGFGVGGGKGNPGPRPYLYSSKKGVLFLAACSDW